MLIGFKFRNYRSFLGEQHLTFVPSSDRTHESTHVLTTGLKSVPRILKSALIVGPNASGKTNLLRAVATCRELVLNSAELTASQFRECHTPYRFTTEGVTAFELDAVVDRTRYRYSFAYDAERIRSEKLLVYRTAKAQRWFERRFNPATQSDEWAPFSPSLTGARESWRKATGSQALFLTSAARLDCRQLAPLVDWIRTGLEVLLPTDGADLQRFADRIRHAGFKTRVLEMLRAVDIQVADLRIAPAHFSRHEDAPRTAGEAQEAGHRGSIEFLYTRPGWAPVWLDSVFEAAGTRRLLGLLVPLLDALDHGSVLLIDEFDRSLHPLVARFLMRLVNEPVVSRKGAQLLLTSHNTTLMDLEFLRRDSIWMLLANEARTGNLTPLLRSSPRKHEMVAKNYLQGRYGAIPRIDRGSGLATIAEEETPPATRPAH